MVKNPAFHPGDIRVLVAVDRPELHHMVNTLVFPAQGCLNFCKTLSSKD